MVSHNFRCDAIPNWRQSQPHIHAAGHLSSDIPGAIKGAQQHTIKGLEDEHAVHM